MGLEGDVESVSKIARVLNKRERAQDMGRIFGMLTLECQNKERKSVIERLLRGGNKELSGQKLQKELGTSKGIFRAMSEEGLLINRGLEKYIFNMERLINSGGKNYINTGEVGIEINI